MNKKDRKKYLKLKYGMTVSDYLDLVKKQYNRCAICSLEVEDNKNLYIDHDHNTGEIRGLLCQKCNSGIGMFNDDIEILESAIKYLKKYQKMSGVDRKLF